MIGFETFLQNSDESKDVQCTHILLLSSIRARQDLMSIGRSVSLWVSWSVRRLVRRYSGQMVGWCVVVWSVGLSVI